MLKDLKSKYYRAKNCPNVAVLQANNENCIGLLMAHNDRYKFKKM